MTERSILGKFDIFARLTHRVKNPPAQIFRHCLKTALILIVFNFLVMGNTAVALTPDPEFNPFQVEVISKSLTAEIRSIPESYSEIEFLRFRIVAGSPGWQISVIASHLTLDDDNKIQPGEIHVQITEENSLPLANPVLIVPEGPAGITDIQIPLSLFTDNLHRPGVYTGWLYLIAQKPIDPQLMQIKVPFTVNVRAQVRHTFQGNKIYFHVGNPLKREQLNGIIEGRLEADIPMAIHITANGHRIDRILQQKQFGYLKYTDETPWIPIAWSFAERTSDFRAPDIAKNDGIGISWIVQGTPGQIDYKIRCSLNPSAEQAPGDYGLSATITLVPLL